MPFPIAALTDEIAPDLVAALTTMIGAGITGAELRTVLGKNVLELSDTEALSTWETIAQAGLSVSGIASPIGKSPIGSPLAEEEARIERACQLARLLHTDRIRIFSFYPPEGTSASEMESLAPEVIRRLRTFARTAETAGVTLVLENEVGLWGDIPDRCRRILEAVASPRLRFAWDPANFLRSGVARPFDEGWPALRQWVACAHVKDCRLGGEHTVAGAGDGQWPELLSALAMLGGMPLVMEPHLQIAGHSVGFTGPERFLQAVGAVRALM